MKAGLKPDYDRQRLTAYDDHATKLQNIHRCKENIPLGKLVFIDIDGTLMTTAQQVPDTARYACIKAIDNGHHLFFSTGRSLPEMYPWLLDIGVEGMVAGGGSYVRIKDHVIADVRIDDDGAAYASSVIDNLEGHWLWEGPETIFSSPQYMDMFTHDSGSSEGGQPVDWKPFERQVESVLRIGESGSCSKGTFILPPYSSVSATHRDSLDGLHEKLDGRFTILEGSVATSRGYVGEILPLGMDKTVGMRLVANELSLNLSDAIAIGDSMNDLDMMRVCGTGVAMGNARPEIRAAADWVTSDINENGFFNAFDRLDLI